MPAEPTMTKTTPPLIPRSQVRGKPDFVATGVFIPLMEKEMTSRGVESAKTKNKENIKGMAKKEENTTKQKLNGVAQPDVV